MFIQRINSCKYLKFSKSIYKRGFMEGLLARSFSSWGDISNGVELFGKVFSLNNSVNSGKEPWHSL